MALGSRAVRWAAVLAGLTVGGALVRRALDRRRIDLRGRVVLVTGGSRGLGLQLAREMVSVGARVVICGRDEATLERARADLVGHGGQVLAVPCDLTRPEQIEALAHRIRERWGGLDVLIHNAGRIEVGPFEHMTEADHRAELELHYFAPLRLVQTFLPDLERRGGRVVNISSIGGRMAVPHLLPYVASKHALTGLSRGLHLELRKRGVIVTTVWPGLMRTGSPRHALFKGQHRGEYTWFVLADSLPPFSIAVEGAARRIRRAVERGEAQVVVGLPAKLALALHDLAPGLHQALWSAADRLLPGPGGVREQTRRGHESDNALTRSPLLGLERHAERTQNEL